MGTQGLPGRAGWCERNADRRRIAQISVITAALAVAPLLAGCSSFSSSSAGAPSINQTMAVPPPPNAAAPASASAAPAYPPPQAQQQANAGNSNSFLNMFRDPPSQDYDARASAYPQQSLTDLFNGSTDQRAAPDPSGAGYPLQPLVGSRQANVPRPPSTYTPSQQPYVPPQPPPAYAAPGQSAYAAPQPTQTANTPPPAQPAPAGAGASNGYPYPQQSLFELPGSTQTQNVPRPPTTYTPSGQPYTPPGGAPTAAAPPTQPPPTESVGGVYPQQSLSDLFKNGGQ
jgi:hypothetical protein